MKCPSCNLEMNHHADKIDYSLIDPAEPEFGSALQEVHSCSGCGLTETRAAIE